MINTVLSLVFAVTSTMLLAAGTLVNPGFIVHAFTDNGVNADTLRTLGIITGVGLIGLLGFPIWDIIDGWFKSVRDNRS